MEQERKFYSLNVINSPDPVNEDAPQKSGGKFCQQTVEIFKDKGFLQLNVGREILPVNNYSIETAQKWVTLPGKNDRRHIFPVQTILPKVQMNRNVPLKQLPRDVEVDRRKRQYAKMDLLEMLAAADLTNHELQPSEEQYRMLSERAFAHFLPISFFDDTNFDCHSPEAWFKLGIVDDQRYPLPAKAWVPTSQSMMDYSWQNVSISGYNEETNLWNAMVLMDECAYVIPKVQFMFMAENPHVFVERLKKASQDRNTAECLIIMEAIVDCVLLQDMRDDYRFPPNPRIEKLLSKCRTDNAFLHNMRTEIYLVFQHLMACYEFEKFIIMMPKEFPNFRSNLLRNSLPKAFKSLISIKERKYIKTLKLNLKEIRHDVLQNTLFYVGAGIEAMESVASECQYVETLSMFVYTFAKALPLSDFLQSQQQNSNNVSSYVKTFWPSKIASGIMLVLRALGKGWLDISLDKWSVYKMCKISRFLLQTKFRMQEAVQVLLEKSIENFSRLLIKPCEQFLNISDDYKWLANEFINTPFPWAKPIFSLIIGISEDRTVTYSTPLEEFDPSLMDIFKKALEKAAGVRYIDAETMTNLRFARNLYILTVELIDDLYAQISEVLHLSYKKAVIPVRAYSKLYERFIPFYLLNVNKFFQDYAAKKPSSQMVKIEILEQKRLKQELRDILPANITIGPFLINVDLMKQYMIKKRTDIIKRLYEFYVQRMHDINEALLDACVAVNARISERPQSIEHLYEIRDFGLLVPERVEQLKAEIQVMWLEYEMLDGFYYNLSDQQFAMKWEAYAWPHNILQRLSSLREEQKNDIDDFRRIHLSEIVGFEERLESLNEEIQAFSLQHDPNKVMETSVEVKKTWKAITELQKLGSTLKFRQTLFEMDELSLEFLESIIESFMPYKNLWTACSDFIKLEEATVGNPMLNIDLDDVTQTIDELRTSLQSSQKDFDEKPEVVAVATTFLGKLDGFQPVIDCIKWLRNEHWIHMHWQELSARSGVDIKYSPAMNFNYCIRKGIMENLDIVKEISEKAESEADALRLALEEEERQREEARVALLRKKEMRNCRKDIL